MGAKDFLDSKFPNSWASNQSLFFLGANANVNAFVYAKDVVLDIYVGGMNEQCIINYKTILAFAERILNEEQGKEYYIFQWLGEDSIKFLGCYLLCREKEGYTRQQNSDTAGDSNYPDKGHLSQTIQFCQISEFVWKNKILYHNCQQPRKNNMADKAGDRKLIANKSFLL